MISHSVWTGMTTILSQPTMAVESACMWQCLCIWASLKVAAKLLHATSGPVKSVEGSLYQRGHDAAHLHFIPTAVTLTIVLHSQPAERDSETNVILSSIVVLFENNKNHIIGRNRLTRVLFHGPPQRQRRNHPRGSKCSSWQGGTCLLLGRNLGNKGYKKI